MANQIDAAPPIADWWLSYRPSPAAAQADDIANPKWEAFAMVRGTGEATQFLLRFLESRHQREESGISAFPTYEFKAKTDADLRREMDAFAYMQFRYDFMPENEFGAPCNWESHRLALEVYKLVEIGFPQPEETAVGGSVAGSQTSDVGSESARLAATQQDAAAGGHVYPASLLQDFRDAWSRHGSTSMNIEAYPYASGVPEFAGPYHIEYRDRVELPPLDGCDQETFVLTVGSYSDEGKAAREFVALARRAGAQLPSDVIRSLRQGFIEWPTTFWCLVLLQDWLRAKRGGWEGYFRNIESIMSEELSAGCVGKEELRSVCISNRPFLDSIDLMERLNAAGGPADAPPSNLAPEQPTPTPALAGSGDERDASKARYPAPDKPGMPQLDAVTADLIDILGGPPTVPVAGAKLAEKSAEAIEPDTRGVAPRRRLFKQWYEATGAPTYHSHATIAKRWNGMSREQRAAICPSSTNTVTRQVVIQDIKRATATP